MITHIETVEQAVSVLNERKWRGRADWRPVSGELLEYLPNHVETNDGNILPNADAIAIAQGLLDCDEIARLKNTVEFWESTTEVGAFIQGQHRRIHDLEGEIAELKQRISKLEALQQEQLDIVIGAGPITCRNGKTHWQDLD